MGLYGDNGKEDGNYYSILGLYRDNGKENGNYYSILGYNGVILGSWRMKWKLLKYVMFRVQRVGLRVLSCRQNIVTIE